MMAGRASPHGLRFPNHTLGNRIFRQIKLCSERWLSQTIKRLNLSEECER
jgi:hypothetical protein